MRRAVLVLATLAVAAIAQDEPGKKWQVRLKKQELRDHKGTLELTMWFETTFPDRTVLSFTLSKFNHLYDYPKNKLYLDRANKVTLPQADTQARVEGNKIKYIAVIPYAGLFDLDIVLSNQVEEDVAQKFHPADYGRRFATISIAAGKPRDVTDVIAREGDQVFKHVARLRELLNKMKGATEDNAESIAEQVKKDLLKLREQIENPAAKIPFDKTRDSVLTGTYQCLKGILVRFEAMATQLKVFLELQKAQKVSGGGGGGGDDDDDSQSDPAHKEDNNNELPADIAGGKLSFDELQKSLNRLRKVLCRESLSWLMVFIKSVLDEACAAYDQAKAGNLADADFYKLKSQWEEELTAIDRGFEKALSFDEKGSVRKLLVLDEDGKKTYDNHGLKAVRDLLTFMRGDIENNKTGAEPENVTKTRSQTRTEADATHTRLLDGQ